MLSALPKLVAAQHPRPVTLSNEGCCFSDEHLHSILAKPDADLAWADYQALLTSSRCTGRYEELVYFVPLAIRYCERQPDEAGDCVSSLIHFLSHEFDRLKDDGLADPLVEALRELFALWIASFHVTHFDKAACQQKGWGLEHCDFADRSDLIRSFVDDLLRYETFAGLAEELIASLAAPPVGSIRSAWFLEISYECRIGYSRWIQSRDRTRAEMQALLSWAGDRIPHDDTPPWSRSARIVELINDTRLLRQHFDSIEPTIVEDEPSPTYWKAIRSLLDFPAPECVSDPAVVPRFSCADAKAFRSRSAPMTPSKNADEPSNPLWPKLKAQRDGMIAAMKELLPPGMPEDGNLAEVTEAFAAMGSMFKGRVQGFEQEMLFRLLLVSGNYALCENESGPFRIPFKDFAAAFEAGQLVEIPEDTASV